MIAAEEREHSRVSRRVLVDEAPRGIAPDLPAEIRVFGDRSGDDVDGHAVDSVGEPPLPALAFTFVQRRERRQVQDREHRQDSVDEHRPWLRDRPGCACDECSARRNER